MCFIFQVNNSERGFLFGSKNKFPLQVHDVLFQMGSRLRKMIQIYRGELSIPGIRRRGFISRSTMKKIPFQVRGDASRSGGVKRTHSVPDCRQQWIVPDAEGLFQTLRDCSGFRGIVPDFEGLFQTEQGLIKSKFVKE